MNNPTAPNTALGALTGLKIGDLAKLTGKTSRALRLYEEMGLLTPSDRSAGGFRLYDHRALERVQFIGSLQELGFSLAEVCDFIQLTAEKSVPKIAMAHLRGRFSTTLQDVQTRLARLRVLEKELKKAVAHLDDCQSCDLHDQGASACASCDTQHAAPPLVREATRTAADQFFDSERAPNKEGAS